MKRFNTISKWKLKGYDGKKCRFKTNNWEIYEWEIYIEDDRVYVLHNSKADWCFFEEIKGYSGARCIYSGYQTDDVLDNLSYNRIEINIEEFVRWEEVLARDDEEDDWDKAIYLTTIDWAKYPFICVNWLYEEEFKEWKPFNWVSCKYIKKIGTKKEYSMNDIASSLGIDVKDLLIKKD